MNGANSDPPSLPDDKNEFPIKKSTRPRRKIIYDNINETNDTNPKDNQIKSPRDNTLIQVDGKELNRSTINPINHKSVDNNIVIPHSPRIAVPKISPKLSPKVSPKIINLSDHQTTSDTVQLISSSHISKIPTISPRIPSPEEEVYHQILESGKKKSQRSHRQSKSPSDKIISQKINTNKSSSTKISYRRHSDDTFRTSNNKLSYRPTFLSNTPPMVKTSHIERTPSSKENDAYDKLSYLDNLSPNHEAYLRDEYTVRFEKLKNNHRGISIPPIRDNEPIKNIIIRHDRWKKYFKQCHSANIYRILLMIYFLFLEAICNKILGLRAEGFAKSSVGFLTQYDDLLMELGDKETPISFGHWPVEIRITLLGLFHMIGFLFIQYVSDWIGKDKAIDLTNMIGQFFKNINNYDPENPEGEGSFSMESMIASLGSLFTGGNNNTTTEQQNKNENKSTYKPMHTE